MRIEGWESLLQKHLEEAHFARFEWGVNDCALWCASWVKKAIGVDYGQLWYNRYASESQLEELMSELGYSKPSDIADEIMPPMDIRFAQRGDIVEHPQGALGICNGVYSNFLTDKGVTRLKTLDCLKAWKVR